MQPHDEIRARSDALAELIEARLGVRGRGLGGKLRAAGRTLPRWVRREAGQLVEAEALLAHPKLRTQADPAALDQAYKRCERWLKSVDPGARRRAYWLNILTVNAFNLLVLAVVLGLAFQLLIP